MKKIISLCIFLFLFLWLSSNDTLRVKLGGKSFVFEEPAGYINYFLLDSPTIKYLSGTSSRTNKPFAFYITLGNLQGIIKQDKIFFDKTLMLFYTDDLIAKHIDDAGLQEISNSICGVNMAQVEKQKVQEILKADINNYFYRDAKLKTSAHYCQSRPNLVYSVSISEVSYNINEKGIVAVAAGVMHAKGKAIYFMFSSPIKIDFSFVGFETELQKLMNAFIRNNSS